MSIISSNNTMVRLTGVEDMSLFAYAQALVSANQHLDQASYHRKLRQHLKFLTQRKTYRNSLSPINQLPVEILANIFRKLERIMAEEHSPQDRHPHNPLSWIPVANICRHWRTTALSCPALWSNITIKYSPLTELMFQRSRASLLHVKFSFKNGADPYNVLRDFMTQHQRLRSIEIEGAPQIRLLSTFDSWAGKQLAHLQVLRIHVNSLDREQVKLSRDVLRAAPCLRILDLEWCEIPWATVAEIGSNLISLRVHNPVAPTHAGRPSFKTMVSCLNVMPRLKALDLKGCLPALENDAPIRAVPIRPLPTSLKLDDWACSLALFMRHIEVPPQAVIKSSLWNISPATVASLDTSLHTVSRTALPTKVRQLKITRIPRSESRLRFDIWATKTFHDPAPAKANHTIQFRQPQISIDDALLAVTRDFDISQVSSVTVSHCALSRNTWVNLFSRVPFLTTIKVSGPACRDFIWALEFGGAEVNLAGGSGASTQQLALTLGGMQSLPPFPSLIDITCDDVDLGVSWNGEPALNQITDVLTERMRSDRPVRKLRIEDCVRFGEQEHRTTRILLHDMEVEWDGRSQFPMETPAYRLPW